MSSTEEVKKSKKNTSRLASPQSLGGKKLLNKISEDPMKLILSMAGLEGRYTNFAGKNLQGANYKDYDLSKSNFEGCDLTDASFINCNLSGCSFVKATMKNINLDGCLLDGSSFKGAKVIGAKMRNVIMSRSKLSHATFDGSDISHSILDDCRIIKTSFRKTILRGTTMRYLESPIKYSSNKSIASFEGADLTAAIIELKSDHIIKIKDAILIGSSLENIKIKDEDLADMDFSRSKLSKIDFNEVKLNNVNFNSSNMWDTKFVDCKLNKVYFNGSGSNPLTFEDSKLEHCSFQYLNGNHIIINKSDLLKCNFICESREEILSISFRGEKSNLVGCKINSCTFKSDESELATLEDCSFYEANIERGLVLVTFKNCHFNKTNIRDNFQECTIEGCVFEEVKFLDFGVGGSKMNNNTFRETFMSGTFLYSEVIGNVFEDFRYVGGYIDNCENFRENNFRNVLFEKVTVSDSKLIGNTFHNGIVFKSFIIFGSKLDNIYVETPQVDQVEIVSTKLHSNDAIIFRDAIIEEFKEESPDSDSSEEKSKPREKNYPKAKELGPRTPYSSDSESDSPQLKNKKQSRPGKKQVTMHKRKSSSS